MQSNDPQIRVYVPDSNPPAKPPRKPRRRRLPQCLTTDEETALVLRARFEAEEAHTTIKRYAAQRDEVILLIGLRMGLRLSEFVDLDITSLDMTGRMCHILNGKGQKDRNLPIPTDIAPLLAAWIGDRKDGPVFPSRYAGHERISPDTIGWRLDRLGMLAGLHRSIHPHMLRHTAATRLLERCGNLMVVMQFLGHKSVSTTQIYCHVTVNELAAAMELT